MIYSFNAVTEMFLASLKASQERSSQDMEAITSGYRVNKASDSPDDIVSIGHLEGALARATQVQTNLSRAKSEVDTAESTIETVVSLLENVQTLAAGALGFNQDATVRAPAAQQVQEILQQLVGLAGASANGRFIFSGDNDHQVQYTVDPANLVTGVKREFKTASTCGVTDVLGATFSDSLTANEIFDHRKPDDTLADDNVFAAVEQLYQGLIDPDTDNGTVTINKAISALKQSYTWVNSALSFYGSVQNRISQSQAISSTYQTNWKTQLGSERDTDMIAAISDMQANQTQQQAALASQATFTQKSLFDYLR